VVQPRIEALFAVKGQACCAQGKYYPKCKFRLAAKISFTVLRWNRHFLKRTSMPSFKVLKGVAHNIGHSFTSLMNYSVDDYSMGHILRFARETGIDTLIIDFVTGQGHPALLLREPISKLPGRYTEMFWYLVQRSGSDRELVRSATLRLTYDLQRTKSGPITNVLQSPYTCEIAIVDVRGKNYSAYFAGWWHIERGIYLFSVRRWWNPFSWLRHQRCERSG